MLLRILSRLDENEQRWQCLRTLRHKLNHYQLNWKDIKEIIDLFNQFPRSTGHPEQQDLLDFLLHHIDRSSLTKIEIDDYFQLTAHYNEMKHFNLLQLIADKLQWTNDEELSLILRKSFPTKSIRSQIEELLRPHRTSQGEMIERFDSDRSQFVLCPSSSREEEEIEWNLILSSRSSNSSFSSSEESFPIRTQSLMGAIKNTFERLKESSS